MYTALITKIRTSPIPGADFVQKGNCSGYTVVVGKEVKDGELGVFFPADGQLSKRMADENNLYRKDPKTGKENKSGYLENNRRIRTIKLRKIPSEGLWLPLSSLSWAAISKKVKLKDNEIDVDLLEEGTQLTHFHGHKICGKYYPRATRERRKSPKIGWKQRWRQCLSRWWSGDARRSFPQHFETAKLRHALASMDLTEDSYIYMTIKMHGTSARSGKVRDTSLKQRVKEYFGFSPKYVDLLGTRRLILPHRSCSDLYRFEAHDLFKNDLKNGEIIYYEIVGFGERGAIMPSHKVKDSKLRKKYGETMTYSYRMRPCDEDQRIPLYGVNFDIYVYRITQNGKELSPAEISTRCEELKVKMVPYVDSFHWKTRTKESLIEKCRVLAEKENLIDSSHIHEGLCIRIISGMKDKTLKYKSWGFCDCEGIAKNSDDYVDPEDL